MLIWEPEQATSKIELPKELGIKLIKDLARIERLDSTTLLFNFKLDKTMLAPLHQKPPYHLNRYKNVSRLACKKCGALFYA